MFLNLLCELIMRPSYISPDCVGTLEYVSRSSGTNVAKFRSTGGHDESPENLA
jgi:hypothetical protein